MRRVGVLMGGESQERDVSRVTGTAVAKALAERRIDVVLLDTADGLRPTEAAGAESAGNPSAPATSADAPGRFSSTRRSRASATPRAKPSYSTACQPIISLRIYCFPKAP